MSVQLIRKVRDRQPIRLAKIDYSNPISKYLVFSFEAGIGKRDLVSGLVGGAISSGVSVSAGKFGRQVNFSGSQASGAFAFGVHHGLDGATSATWDILVYFNTSNPTTHLFGQWDGFTQEWLVQANAGTMVWVPADGNGAGLARTRFDSASSLFPSAGWYRVIASWRGGTNYTVLVNGLDKTSTFSTVSSSASSIGTDNTSDTIQIGMVNGGSALNGSVVFARAWRRGFSLQECLGLHANPWQIFEPETIPLFFAIVAAQFARPTADSSTGTWTASTGSDLFAMLDETTADDGDYIITSGTSTCEVALTSLSDPASSADHIVRYRISATSGGITVRLRQGTTTIATWTHATAPTSLTTYTQTLTGGEADSITDYTALKLQFEAT